MKVVKAFSAKFTSAYDLSNMLTAKLKAIDSLNTHFIVNDVEN
jgi:hypothetical protein